MAQLILADIGLQGPCAVAKADKSRFAEIVDRQHAAGQRKFPCGLIFVRDVANIAQNVGYSMRYDKSIGKGVDAFRSEGFNLPLMLSDQVPGALFAHHLAFNMQKRIA